MSQSLSMIYMHVVFSTKNRVPLLKNNNIRQELYAYIATIIVEHDSCPIEIGGYEDHVHIFLNLSKNVCLKDMVRYIKKSTSKWIKSKGENFTNFYWQIGYGAFSVGEVQKEKTINYIKNQEGHHKKISFQDELMIFLKKNNMDYNEKYLWE